jgi:hypothetical protein
LLPEHDPADLPGEHLRQVLDEFDPPRIAVAWLATRSFRAYQRSI